MPDKTLLYEIGTEPLKRRRFPIGLKFAAVRIWLARASLRKTARALKHEALFRHEAARQWTHRLQRLFPPKLLRRRIVVDETSIHLANEKEIFGWAAFDGHTKEVLARGPPKGDEASTRCCS
jgi:hypothetical protein